MANPDPTPRGRAATRLLIALAVAVALGVVSLVWELRGPTRPTPAARDGVAGERAPRRAQPHRAREGDDQRIVPLAELLAQASRRLGEQAARCAGGTERGTGTITVSYAVVFDGGTAHVEDVRALRNTIADDAVTQCVLDRLRAARWDTPGALDRRANRIDAFAVRGRL